jgi:hypothetical protein
VVEPVGASQPVLGSGLGGDAGARRFTCSGEEWMGRLGLLGEVKVKAAFL